jgi:hypothetical protein
MVAPDTHRIDAPIEPLLLRVRDVARCLAISERQVWVLIRAGRLRVVHPPEMRAVRILRRDLDALINQWRDGDEHESA